MRALPVTDNGCISQQFKDPQQLQPEKVPPLSASLVLKAQTGFPVTGKYECFFVYTGLNKVKRH